MVNLIERSDSGTWKVKGIPWNELYMGAKITRRNQQILYGCLAKLKDYEATGLSPVEVQQLKEKNAPVQ